MLPLKINNFNHMKVTMKAYRILSLGLFLIICVNAQQSRASADHREPKNQESSQSESLFRTLPFLQNPIGGGITISWFTNAPSHGWIEYGTSEEFGQKAVTSIGGQAVANVKHHKIRLKDLQPGKKYYYRACSREVLLYRAYAKEFGETEYSETYTFTVPGTKSANFTALILNDLHKKQQTLDGLMQVVKGTDYNFVVYNGDCVDDPAIEDHAIDFISYSNEQVNAAEKPVFYLRGNHEIRGAYSVGLNEIIDYVGGQTFGAFNWGDTRFILLDCGEDKPDSHEVYYGLNNFNELRNAQKDFLEKERKNRDFKKASKRVLIHHIPLHGLKENRYAPCTELWSEVLNRSNISLALNGHTHRFAYHEPGSKGNAYPVVIGGGYKDTDATVMILSKIGKTMNLKVFSYEGKILLDQNF